MWGFIIITLFAISFISLYCLSRKLYKFGVFKNHLKGKFSKYAVPLLVVIIIFIILFLTIGIMNALIVVLHFIVIWTISDIVAYIFRKITKRERKKYISGVVAITVTVIYLAVASYNAFNVSRTEYKINSEKITNHIKIVGFSDSHIGATFGYEKFSQYVDRMNSEKPDIAVIVGDYVDDSTTKNDMIKSCEALKNLHTKYGVYFVFGNHDVGYYSSRDFNKDDLIFNLEKNNVKVLEDEAVLLPCGVNIIGRKDKHEKRLPIENLILNNKYNIVLDHQPVEYKQEESAGTDLVISGHTHGGQMIPVNHVGEWINVNDMTYGHKKSGNTDFIVSSGISNWELYFKTGCKSEYFVIDIK